MNKKRAIWDSVLISGIHMNYWAGSTIQMTFLVSFMTMSGYTASQVGLAVAVFSGVNFTCQPVWGYLSDRMKNVRRTIIICLVCATPLLLLLPGAVESRLSYLMIVYTLLACFQGPVAGLLDSLTYGGAETNPYIVYGIARGSGSLFSAVAMLVSGELLYRIGVKYAFVVEAALFVLAAVCAMLYSGTGFESAASPKSERTALGGTIREILQNRACLFLFLSVILLNIGVKAGYTFVPMMVLEMGGTTASNGYVMAINTVGMMPCMLLYNYLHDKRKVSNKILYLLACLFTIARILSLAMVGSMPAMYGIQLISSLQYGFLQPAMLTAITEIVPQRIRTTAITLAAALQLGVSSLAGDYAAGLMAERIGMRPMFLLLAGVAVLGLGSFWHSTRLLERKDNVKSVSG